MKKLLGIIVLGLLLSGNAYAKRIFCVKVYFEDPKEISYSKQVILSDKRTHLLKPECYRTTSGPQYELYQINKKNNKSLYLFFENILGKGSIVTSLPVRETLSLNDFKNILPNNHRNFFSKTFTYIDKLEKTKLTKKEPSQTQKVVVEKKLKTTTKVTKLKKNTNNSFNSYSKILLKDDNQIHINTIDDWTTSKDTFEIAKKHCSSFGKYAFLVKRPAFRNSKLDKYYIKQGQKLNLSSVFEYICSKENIILAPSYAFSAGAKLDKKWSNFGISNNIGSGLKSSTNTNKSQNIMFTIKDKKEQCSAIGFKPETDKFADCVLRLVELDVKKQQTNKISTAQNSGNDALAKQLKQQQYDRDTQYLLDLGQQLLQPKSSSYSTCSYIDLGSGMSKVKCN